MEHRQVDSLPTTSLRASGDDPARFLRELRQLRDGAGLGPAELAARAHYPYDRIRAAEVGPTLPDLPVLSAYVRGCGGTTEEWEERWRSLTSAPTLPVLDARPAGGSTAADAGARIGSISPAADTPDPAVIMAALDRVGEEMAVGAPAPLPARTSVTTIEPRPMVPPAPVKTAAAKAAATKVAAWETTTMRTAWSSTTGPIPRQSDLAGTTTASTGTGPRTIASHPGASGYPPATVREPESSRSGGPVSAGTTGSIWATASTGTTGSTGSAGSTGSTGPTGSAGATGATASADRSGTTVATPAGKAGSAPSAASASPSSSALPPASGVTSWHPPALSRTTLAALVAIAICLLVALLAIVV